MEGRPAPPRKDRLGDSRWTPLGLPALFLLPGPAAAAGAAVLAATPLCLRAGTFPPRDCLGLGGMSVGQTLVWDSRAARTRATASCVGRQMDEAMKRVRARKLWSIAQKENDGSEYKINIVQPMSREEGIVKSSGLLSGGGWFNVVEKMEGRPV